jgi:hypothetical protein
MKTLTSILAAVALCTNCSSQLELNAEKDMQQDSEKSFYEYVFNRYEKVKEIKKDEFTKQELEQVYKICQEKYGNDRQFLSQLRQTIDKGEKQELKKTLNFINSSMGYEYAIDLVNRIISSDEISKETRYKILDYWISQKNFKPITKAKYAMMREKYDKILSAQAQENITNEQEKISLEK